MVFTGVYIFFAICVLCPPIGFMVAAYILFAVIGDAIAPASRRRRNRW
jgi:phage shock protein PspC (stress-responsive transcriptional regulator)